MENGENAGNHFTGTCCFQNIVKDRGNQHFALSFTMFSMGIFFRSVNTQDYMMKVKLTVTLLRVLMTLSYRCVVCRLNSSLVITPRLASSSAKPWVLQLLWPQTMNKHSWSNTDTQKHFRVFQILTSGIYHSQIGRVLCSMRSDLHQYLFNPLPHNTAFWRT